MNIQNYFDNPNITLEDQLGIFSIMKFEKDLSLFSPSMAQTAHFMKEMEIHRRQPVANLDGSIGLILNSHAMQFTAGKVECKTNVKGVGDFLGKLVSAAVTKNNSIKPLYSGVGKVFIEPSYYNFLLIDISKFQHTVFTDHLFVGCEDTLDMSVVAIRNLSGAVLGNEHLYHMCLSGKGVALIECPVHYKDLICIELNNEEVKIEGHHIVMWSNSLSYTIERSSKTLLGSTITGQGLLHVFRGSGHVWLSSAASSLVDRFHQGTGIL